MIISTNLLNNHRDSPDNILESVRRHRLRRVPQHRGQELHQRPTQIIRWRHILRIPQALQQRNGPIKNQPRRARPRHFSTFMRPDLIKFENVRPGIIQFSDFIGHVKNVKVPGIECPAVHLPICSIQLRLICIPVRIYEYEAYPFPFRHAWTILYLLRDRRTEESVSFFIGADAHEILSVGPP